MRYDPWGEPALPEPSDYIADPFGMVDPALAELALKSQNEEEAIKAWLANLSRKTGTDYNINDPLYNYREAYRHGVEPTYHEEHAGNYPWRWSDEFKAQNYSDIIDHETGLPKSDRDRLSWRNAPPNLGSLPVAPEDLATISELHLTQGKNLEDEIRRRSLNKVISNTVDTTAAVAGSMVPGASIVRFIKDPKLTEESLMDVASDLINFGAFGIPTKAKIPSRAVLQVPEATAARRSLFPSHVTVEGSLAGNKGWVTVPAVSDLTATQKGLLEPIMGSDIWKIELPGIAQERDYVYRKLLEGRQGQTLGDVLLEKSEADIAKNPILKKAFEKSNILRYFGPPDSIRGSWGEYIEGFPRTTIGMSLDPEMRGVTIAQIAADPNLRPQLAKAKDLAITYAPASSVSPSIQYPLKGGVLLRPSPLEETDVLRTIGKRVEVNQDLLKRIDEAETKLLKEKIRSFQEYGKGADPSMLLERVASTSEHEARHATLSYLRQQVSDALNRGAKFADLPFDPAMYYLAMEEAFGKVQPYTGERGFAGAILDRFAPGYRELSSTPSLWGPYRGFEKNPMLGEELSMAVYKSNPEAARRQFILNSGLEQMGYSKDLRNANQQMLDAVTKGKLAGGVVQPLTVGDVLGSTQPGYSELFRKILGRERGDVEKRFVEKLMNPETLSISKASIPKVAPSSQNIPPPYRGRFQESSKPISERLDQLYKGIVDMSYAGSPIRDKVSAVNWEGKARTDLLKRAGEYFGENKALYSYLVKAIDMSRDPGEIELMYQTMHAFMKQEARRLAEQAGIVYGPEDGKTLVKKIWERYETDPSGEEQGINFQMNKPKIIGD